MSWIALALADEVEVQVGSYGRADASTRTDGSGAETVTVVSHPGRLYADPYLELDVAWTWEPEPDGARFRSVVTPALSGPLFHTTGQFDAALAVRNLYAEADTFGIPGLSAWAGSRMYRGDDVYLLDFWPLDSLNTVGGGLGWEWKGTGIQAHAGVNRLWGEDWQVQTIEEPLPGSVETETVSVLDRQRLVASLKGSQELPLGAWVLRPKLVLELHRLPAGRRLVEEPDLYEELPADRGGMVGGELSFWGQDEPLYAHLFYRHATGLAAVGELTIPTDGFADDGTVAAAREDVVALAANWDAGKVSIAAGAYARAFADADGEPVDVDDYTEAVLALRPSLQPTEHLAIQLEASREWRVSRGVNPRTDTVDRPAITRLTVMPAIQPARGTFARPMVYLRYTASVFDEDALEWFPEGDTRVGASVQHEVGLGAEWWVNSVSYR